MSTCRGPLSLCRPSALGCLPTLGKPPSSFSSPCSLFSPMPNVYYLSRHLLGFQQGHERQAQRGWERRCGGEGAPCRRMHCTVLPCGGCAVLPCAGLTLAAARVSWGAVVLRCGGIPNGRDVTRQPSTRAAEEQAEHLGVWLSVQPLQPGTPRSTWAPQVSSFLAPPSTWAPQRPTLPGPCPDWLFP